MKTNVHVHSYRQLRLEFDFDDDILVHENGCKDLRADEHITAKNGSGVDAEDAYEEGDVDTGLENVRKGIAVSLSVIVVEKIDKAVDWIHVGDFWLFDSSIKDVNTLRLRENDEAARWTTVPHFVTHVIK